MKEPNIFKVLDSVSITGKTKLEESHKHKYTIDGNGNGVTTNTEPKLYMNHIHKIKNKTLKNYEHHTHTF